MKVIRPPLAASAWPEKGRHFRDGSAVPAAPHCSAQLTHPLAWLHIIHRACTSPPIAQPQLGQRSALSLPGLAEGGRGQSCCTSAGLRQVPLERARSKQAEKWDQLQAETLLLGRC